MNLRPRFLWLTTALFLLTGLVVWIMVQQISVSIIEQWATRYAEKQTLYDKSRLLQPVMREIALSRQLAESTVIRTWAMEPENETLWQAAERELENFRANFDDQSYFYALLDSGAYYHNNAQGEYSDEPLRYYLSPDEPNDRWFYDIVEQDRDIHLNVNPDVELGVVKLWIDVLVRSEDRVIGVAGTGLDLTRFLNNVVETHEPGISTLFMDHIGAIQLYRQQDRIAYASVSAGGQIEAEQTLFGLVDNLSDQDAINKLMVQLRTETEDVLTTMVTVDGRQQVLGMAYLPELDWYEVTLMDLDTILPLSLFQGLLIGFGVILLVALIIMQVAFSRFVLKPLTRLEEGINAVRLGNTPGKQFTGERNDEIGRLTRHLKTMADAVSNVQQSLEDAVHERTRQLEELSQTDPLTGLLNRRGINQRLDQAYSQLQREGRPMGLVWLDIDHFKLVNDLSGHEAGDAALISIAEEIRKELRPYDCASRWGGDEFMLLIQTDDRDRLSTIADRLLTAVRQLPHPGEQHLTISVSTCVVQPEETLTAALKRADAAMYEAKQAGRDCYRLAYPA